MGNHTNTVFASTDDQNAKTSQFNSSSAIDIIKERANAALHQNSLPQDVETQSSETIIADHQLSEEELKELTEKSANDNWLPHFPSDPKDLVAKVAELRASADNKILILQNTPLSANAYLQARVAAQNSAASALLAECKLGEVLQAIPARKGLKKNSELRDEDNLKTKAKVIEEDYGLSPRQARDIQNLIWDNVKKAIEIAFSREEPVTRALALSDKVKKLVRNDNTQAAIEDVAESASPENVVKIQKLILDPQSEDVYKTLTLDKPVNVTVLFANIGIGTTYLKEMNLHCAVANEYLPKRAAAHAKLYPDCEMIEGDISKQKVINKIVAAHKAKGCEIILSSPPCQVASGLNTSKTKGFDSRATLFYDTLKVVEAVKPKYFLIENVKNWLDSYPEGAKHILGDKSIGKYVADELDRIGYDVNIGVFNAADYGTSETRNRSFVLATRKDLKVLWKFPKKEKVRPVMFDKISDLCSLEPGEVDPNNKWHYALPLTAHEIDFLAHTPTGESAWDNNSKHQPKNKLGSYSRAQFQRSYSRTNWQFSCDTITGQNGSIGSLNTVHPGRPLSDGTYSDCRVLSILELLRLIGLPDDFLEPLDLPMENGMLSNSDESFVRDCLGEHFCPLHLKALLSTLPYIKDEDIEPVVAEVTDTTSKAEVAE